MTTIKRRARKIRAATKAMARRWKAARAKVDGAIGGGG